MTCKVNISIDDVTPHPCSSEAVLEKCYNLIAVFPDIKFTLFVPTSYYRYETEEIYPLNAHPDFCNTLRGLSPKNFEVGWHGHRHGILGKSNNDEFRYLDKASALSCWDEMKRMAEETGLLDLFKPIFRPSAFRMSPGSFSACKGVGMKVLALSDKSHCVLEYEGHDKKFNKVVYYNVNPPDRPLQLFQRTEIVYHACNWDRSYLTEELAYDLQRFLESSGDLEFVFMEDM